MARTPKLTDGLPGTGTDPTLATLGDTQAQQQMAPPGQQLVTVFLVNAVRTSAGPGPGPKTLPSDEANRLIGSKLAVYGDRPPRNFLDGGQQGPVTPVREFGSNFPVKSATSN